MSAPASEPKKPGKIASLWEGATGWTRRLSLPARVALTAAACLLLAVIFAWVAFLLDPRNVPWRHSLSPVRVLIVLFLIGAIPLVIYRGLKLWLEGVEHEFPDIDFAFRAGLDALAENGIAIDSTPLFLLIGSEGDAQERAVVAASGRSLSVRAMPTGPAALHWYASPSAIYLFCSSASWLSAIAHLVDVRRSTAGGPGPLRLDVPDFTESAPPMAAAPAPAMAASSPAAPRAAVPPTLPPVMPEPTIRGTISVDQFLAGRGAEAPPSPMAAPAPAAASASPRGTLMMNAPVATAPARVTTAQASAVEEGQAAAVLTAQEAAIQRRRFEHVCSLVARARDPVCPANGIVALIPYEAVQVNPREAEALQRALHGDLETALGRLRLRCPVTVLFTGLERERGFSELVRRVGQQRALTQRFGRGFDVAALATKEELAAFALHVCGAFEDWIYTLFREQGALTRPGNTHLFNLLCRVRFNLKSRLTDLLAEGLGFDGDANSTNRLLVSGCYFAATGATPDRQAFVKSVFDKLDEEQESIEWTQSAQREFRILKWLTIGAWTLAAALGVFAAAILLRSFSR